jgi:hypothetical protein
MQRDWLQRIIRKKLEGLIVGESEIALVGRLKLSTDRVWGHTEIKKIVLIQPAVEVEQISHSTFGISHYRAGKQIFCLAW